jgi:putative hydrolase of the HAD superfamily
MPQPYKHLFFDLDHTLWDFEQSATQTFALLFEKHQLKLHGIPSLDDFIKEYTIHNTMLWESYRNGELKKEILRSLRFENTLKEFGIHNPQLAESIGDDYIYHAPRTVFLMPGAVEVLQYLYPKYFLHLITNGFEEVQHIKVREADLGKFFSTITTSEEAGVKKPDKKIFDHALQKAGAKAGESLMIGDTLEVDIEGARHAGLDQVYYNPQKTTHAQKVSYEIVHLVELMEIL